MAEEDDVERARSGRRRAAAAVELTELEEQARSFARDSRAASTWRAYESDFADFRTWCAERVSPVEPLPATPATVALYITALAAKGRKPSTIRRRLASISVAHQVAGFETPTTDAGCERCGPASAGTRAWRPARCERPARRSSRRWSLPLGDGLADARDRTLLLFGFAGALRRSELVALDVEDVSEDDGGLRLVLRRSKTDQEAEGTIRGLPYGSHPATCPVRAWRRWLDRIRHRRPARRSDPSIVTATSGPSASATGRWPTWSSAARWPSASTAPSPVTPSAPASPPRATPRARPSWPSCATAAGDRRR